MEHASQVALWILANRKNLNFKAQKLTWVQDYGFNLFDYAVSIKIDDREFEGRGTDSLEDLAIEKAVTEAIERYFVFIDKNLSTTNGVAAHPIKEEAIKNAKYELIERDLFLTHFHSGTPFQPLSQEIWDSYIPARSKETLEAKKIDLKLYNLGNQNDIFSVLAVASGANYQKPFGIVVGFGTKSALDKAILSAVIELFRHLAYLLNSDDRIESMSLEQFYKLEKPTFFDHGKLALDLKYFKEIEHLFRGNFQENIKPISEIEIDVEKLEDTPFFLAKAKSLQAVNLYLGRPSFSEHELLRIHNFSNRVPHPMR